MHLRTNQRALWMLFVGLLALSAWTWLVNSVAPSSASIALFFLLTMTGIIMLVTFFSASARLGWLCGIGFVAFLFLRYLGLRNPIYVVLLLIVLTSLELTWKKR